MEEPEPKPPSPLTIEDFLLGLIGDPDRLRQFHKDPQGALAASGLNERQQEILRSQDPTRIQHAIEYESGYDERRGFWLWPRPVYLDRDMVPVFGVAGEP